MRFFICISPRRRLGLSLAALLLGAFTLGATAGSATAEAVSSQSYEFDPGSRIRGAQPQLFSGSIGFTYGFDLPPGRGGLTPALLK